MDCTIDQLKPGLKSIVNGAIFFLLFKKRLRKCASGQVQNARSLCLLDTGMHSSTQTCQKVRQQFFRR